MNSSLHKGQKETVPRKSELPSRGESEPGSRRFGALRTEGAERATGAGKERRSLENKPL